MNCFYSFSLSFFMFISLMASTIPIHAEVSFDPALRKEFWNSPEFQRKFLASFGANSSIEPRFENPEEQIFFQELGDVMRDDPARAIQQLSERITATSSAILSYTLGALHYQEGNNESAIEHYNIALSKFPDYLRAHKNLGISLVREGRFKEAIKPLTETINLGGSDGTIYGLLGFAYLNETKYQPAKLAYERAVLLEPDNMDWQLGLIKCKIAEEEYQDAVRLLDGLLESNPKSDHLWQLQANVYLQMDKPQKAAVNFEILRKSGKANLQNLMLLGDIYMINESSSLALDVYKEAIEQDGQLDIKRSLRAAEIMVSRGVWEEAQILFKTIRQFHEQRMSEEESFQLLKMESQVAIANGNGDDALKVLEEIIQKNPLDGEALLLSASFYAQNEDTERAENRFDLASKISGFEASAWLQHAQLLVKQQKYAKAIELLQKAQKAEPRDNVQKYLEAVQRVAQAASS